MKIQYLKSTSLKRGCRWRALWLKNRTTTMACSGTGGDKYRDYLSEDEVKNTKWRSGPPSYDVVDKLFEEGRTHVCYILYSLPCIAPTFSCFLVNPIHQNAATSYKSDSHPLTGLLDSSWPAISNLGWFNNL